MGRYLFPQYPPKETDWEYKTRGVFSQKNFAGGSYAVLLTVRAIMGGSNRLTWFPGVELRTTGTRIESDLIALASNDFVRLQAQPTLLIGEVKSFGGCIKEIKKLHQWMQVAPNATVLMATLADGFSSAEKALLEEISIFGRDENEWFNPRLILLSAQELLCNELPPACWKNRNDFDRIQSLFDYSNEFKGRSISRMEGLAYATQSIHLSMKHPFDRR